MPARRSFAAQVVIQDDRRSNHLRRSRDRQPDQMVFRDPLCLHVKTRQPERPANDVSACRQPAPGFPRNQRPKK